MTSKNQRRQPNENTATKFRRLLTESVSDEDFRAVILALVTSAKGGDLGAAKLLIDRCCGKPSVADELESDSSSETSNAPVADENGEPTGLQARKAALATRIAALSH
ncbi:MAG UNVERIFIED_CONTAM: hypothetical protein LVR18_48735 [Planctomycetaceae bacterium]|jgi:hypothetical protein